ncbi:ankyrin repeat domain-containing protein [Vibrio mangrovi]|uniref:Ankyrin repeat domain-containing protein n=1 Tax=Vibrio mangrovi TaxID=474394 RepID=A0A1Y6ITC8_9VIBR|nr:ankyrin repeat domain-containing protein [Vibrio mangrovi]MDW6001903.1 ankyrin repeat domain-containing protein [Vibrio mangrovi]SMS00070.1 Ankyrin repeats (3 copies) [Vibrio mangrovi]
MKQLLSLFLLLLPCWCFAAGPQPDQPSTSKHTDSDELIRLFFAAARIGETEVLNTFLDAGFPINQRNPQSYTALMVAAYNGQKDATELLLERGANACIQDKRGNTAIMGAIIKGEFQIARKLYQASCDANIRNNAGLTLEAFAEKYTQGGMPEVLHP